MLPPAPDLLLKVTPPRVPRQLLARETLQMAGPRLRDAASLLVQAPAGYGKTSLLAQWRLELIGHGGVVAWFSSQPQDDEARLLQGLTLAVRLGASRPAFGQHLLDAGVQQEPLEGVTRWLAELAQAALDLTLVIDEADRLPPASRALLAYLLRNQPPNLRVIVAARADCDLGLDDLLTYGQALRLGPAELRFSLAEALDLARQRLGDRLDLDMAARLHELCEGWPLGLQLLLTALDRGADARAALSSLRGSGSLRQQLLELLLANLSEADVRFLEDVSLVDHLHPALCAALSGRADAADCLARLVRDTPLLSCAEGSDWLRLHALARERLRERVQARPATEQAALQQRAAAWLESRGMLEAAARHAWAAGQRGLALDLAERSVYEAMTRHGHHATVLEWLARLSPEELQQRPRLQLAAAWSLALSEHHEAAGQVVARILAQPRVDEALRCECALILSGAAVYADDPDRFAALHDPWAQQPPLTDPLLLQIHANRSAFRSLLAGEPALARLRLQQPGGQEGDGSRYVAHWADLIRSMSCLWEGQVHQAEAQLRLALRHAETELGRRSTFACMLAALLAAALWEKNQPAEATALLANRLDMLERSGLPETVLLGYRTMARIANAAGAEHRALELLAALDAVGQARRLPRLRIASLTEQMRLHAGRFRSETCRALLVQLDELLAAPDHPSGPLWQGNVAMLAALARGHAAIAAKDWRTAAVLLDAAVSGAQALKLGRFRIEAQALRAYALDRCGERGAAALMREAMDLATSHGLARVFIDAHPELGDWVRQLQAGDEPPATGAARGVLAGAMRVPAAAEAARPRVAPSMALTPKEREVLDLLARNLSNKEIALAMQVGEETIKWHVKNLFAKLDAGTRKQVVGRARILGLLPPLE